MGSQRFRWRGYALNWRRTRVAAVGVSTDQAHSRDGLTFLEWGDEHLDRAVIEGVTLGFTRLAVDAKGRVLGATVVGPRAGETLGNSARSVIAHELGHLVGLAHGNNASQIMYPRAQPAVTEFGSGDLAGLAQAGSGACLPDL